MIESISRSPVMVAPDSSKDAVWVAAAVVRRERPTRASDARLMTADTTAIPASGRLRIASAASMTTIVTAPVIAAGRPAA